MKSTCLLVMSSVVITAPVIAAAESPRIEISMSSSGAITLGVQKVTMEELASHLRSAAAKETKPELLIIASEKTPLAALAAVMELCRSVGFKKFSLQSY